MKRIHNPLVFLFAALILMASACTAPAAAPTATFPPPAAASPLPIDTVAATTTPLVTEPPSMYAPPAATDLTPSPTALPPTAQASNLPTPPAPFDGARSMRDVENQVALGPRVPGSEAHAAVIQLFRAELEANGWQVEIQETTYGGQPVRNVIAKRGAPGDPGPWTIIGAHFDSRMRADNDPDPANHDKPVPAANDGASGAAVLLELSRVLPQNLPGQVWLAFFDSEDQGRLPGWDWILGSRALAESLQGTPTSVIVVDMIGDADLNLYHERNSSPELTQQIWDTAASLGYTQFIPEPKFSMLDDHTPFLEKGIRAIDIIDFDYPYWHTVADTPDKVSPESLRAVGDTVLHWLLVEHRLP